MKTERASRGVNGNDKVDSMSKSVTRLYIGGVPKNATAEMIVARFAAVPNIKVVEVNTCLKCESH